MEYSKTVTVKEGVTLTATLIHSFKESNIFADDFGYDDLLWEGVMDIKGDKVDVTMNNIRVATKATDPGMFRIYGQPRIQETIEKGEADVVSWFYAYNFRGEKKTCIALSNVDLGKIITDIKNELIDEMHANGEGLKHLSPAQKDVAKAEKEIRIAKEVVAEVTDPEKLMTRDQIKKWRISYNNINNEGGEGYIPHQISKEEYEDAVKLLGGQK